VKGRDHRAGRLPGLGGPSGRRSVAHRSAGTETSSPLHDVSESGAAAAALGAGRDPRPDVDESRPLVAEVSRVFRLSRLLTELSDGVRLLRPESACVWVVGSRA